MARNLFTGLVHGKWLKKEGSGVLPDYKRPWKTLVISTMAQPSFSFSFHLSSLMCVTLQSSPVQSSRLVCLLTCQFAVFYFLNSDVILFSRSSSNIYLLLGNFLSSFFPRVLSLAFVLFMWICIFSQSFRVFSSLSELFLVMGQASGCCLSWHTVTKQTCITDL